MSLISLNIPRPEQRSIGDPTTPLTAIAVWNEMDGGPTASGEMISERTALAISTVYTCVTTLSDAISSLPCRLYRREGKGKSEATDNYLYDMLMYAPNEEQNAPQFWATMVGCSALTGNGYAEIRRLSEGTITGLWPLNPLKTEPHRKPDGTLAYKTTDGMGENTYRIIEAKNVLHFPLFSMDGIRGVSPISAARESFALAKATEKYGSRYFGNGAHQDAILINKAPKPDPKAQREFKESFQEAYGGSNAHKQAILFGDWDVKAIGVSPENSQFLGVRGYQRSEIAAMFHLQPHQVGDTSRLSNANHVQAELSFVVNALRPIAYRIEQEIKRKLLSSQRELFVEFDFSERTRGDMATQMRIYATARQWGLLTSNECREDMGYNPVGAEGDVLASPVNMMNAANLLKDDDEPVQQDPDQLKVQEQQQ